MVWWRLCEKLRGNAKRYEARRREVVWEGDALLSALALLLSLFSFAHLRPRSPSHPRVDVGVASKLGQSLVAVASRFGDSKEGSFLFLLISFHFLLPPFSFSFIPLLAPESRTFSSPLPLPLRYPSSSTEREYTTWQSRES